MSASISPSVPTSSPDLSYRPQPKQEAWHECPAYESGFGGAKFGGKSIALLMEATRYADHPRYRGILFRRTYPRLQELMDRAWQWFPGRGGVWNGEAKAWTFPSGARLLMRHCQDEEDKRNYHGHEYQFMGFDQLEEFTDTQYAFLLAQNRSGVADLEPYTRSTFNPGGIGHGWVKQRFIDHGSTTCALWWDMNDDGRKLPSRCFHFANIDDNPIGEANDPTYRGRLQNLHDAERRALLYGDWDQFEGQVFAEWRRNVHVIAPLPIPSDWPRFHATDYGYNAPSCTLWAARSPHTGRVIVYRERYETQKSADQQALKIKLWSADERYRRAVGDPSMWNKESTGRSIAQQFGEHGVNLVPAANDRLAGLLKVHQYLAWSEQQPPKLQVFVTCANLIRTLPALVYDAVRVEDVDTDGEDHAYDTLRYLVMAIDLVKGQERPAHTPYGMGKRRAA